MDGVRLCWQVIPGGRTECTSPISEEIAELRLKEQAQVFPALRLWIVAAGEDGARFRETLEQ
jgi:hypothetical protein